jgi:hypothetical protein
VRSSAFRLITRKLHNRYQRAGGGDDLAKVGAGDGTAEGNV